MGRSRVIDWWLSIGRFTIDLYYLYSTHDLRAAHTKNINKGSYSHYNQTHGNFFTHLWTSFSFRAFLWNISFLWRLEQTKTIHVSILVQFSHLKGYTDLQGFLYIINKGCCTFLLEFSASGDISFVIVGPVSEAFIYAFVIINEKLIIKRFLFPWFKATTKKKKKKKRFGQSIHVLYPAFLCGSLRRSVLMTCGSYCT